LNIRDHVKRKANTGAKLFKEAMEFVVSFFEFLTEKKWRLFLFLFLEGWVHSLAYHHVSELQSIIDAIPFLRSILEYFAKG